MSQNEQSPEEYYKKLERELKVPQPLRGIAGQDTQPMGLCSRETSKSLLQQMIIRKESELRNLKGLHAALPESMGPGADEALWSILCSYR